MTPIKYEPFAFHFYLYSLNSLWFYGMSILGKSMVLFLFIFVIHIVLLALHLYSKGDIIGEISEHEIKLNHYTKPIPLDEIIKWSYFPPIFSKMLVTPSSILEFSRIEIETKENKYKIEGANDFEIHKYLNQYLPKKQRGMDITSVIIMNIVGIIPIIVLAIFSGR